MPGPDRGPVVGRWIGGRMCRSCTWSSFVRAVLVVVGAMLSSRAQAGFPVTSWHLEGGLGSSALAGLTTSGGTVGAGISMPLRGRARAAFEFCASADDGSGTYIPEGPRPGSRSLTTFMFGMEMIASRKLRGPFACLGLGVGHVTLTGALAGWRDFPNNGIPSRNDTGLALGAGAGYRFSVGPGPFGIQLALRTHAIVKKGQTPAAARAFTVGLAY